jgi:hypothetical protein
MPQLRAHGAVDPSPRSGGISVVAASSLQRAGEPNGCLNDVPCPPCTSHGASIRRPLGAAAGPGEPSAPAAGGQKPLQLGGWSPSSTPDRRHDGDEEEGVSVEREAGAAGHRPSAEAEEEEEEEVCSGGGGGDVCLSSPRVRRSLAEAEQMAARDAQAAVRAAAATDAATEESRCAPATVCVSVERGVSVECSRHLLELTD